MTMTMINTQVAVLLVAAAAVVADLPPGSNTYLPPIPTKGYTYPRPTPSFPAVTRPTPSFPVTPIRPTTSFPPIPPRPSIPNFSPGPRPTPFPTPRPTPGYPDFNGQPSGPNEHTLTPIHHDHGDHHHHEPGMPFDFNYAVKDDAYGNDYSHNAASDGDVVRGEYRVKLPDGRLQIVQYTADWKLGFNAQVSYEGTPRYDVPRPSTGTFNGY